METISFEHIQKIRVHINRIEKRTALLKDRTKWSRLTSGLDVLEDTACAVQYYIDSQYPTDLGGKYLVTHGLLQSLYVQGDAAISLSATLLNRQVDFAKNYPEAYRVREIRNDVTGHPTQRGKSEHIYLIQTSLRKESIEYLKLNSENYKSRSVRVDMTKAISEMAICINTILAEIIDVLDAEFREYIEQHKDRKMKDIFASLGYAKAKVLGEEYLDFWGYGATKRMVKECEDEIVKRYGSIEAIEAYECVLEEIHKIYLLIDDGVGKVPLELQDDIEKCLMQLLFVKLEELENLSEETDEYFENYGDLRPQRPPTACKIDIPKIKEYGV